MRSGRDVRAELRIVKIAAAVLLTVAIVAIAVAVAVNR